MVDSCMLKSPVNAESKVMLFDGRMDVARPGT